MGSSSFALQRPACLRHADALSRLSSGIRRGHARARRLLGPLVACHSTPRPWRAVLPVCSTSELGLSVGGGRLDIGYRLSRRHSEAWPRASGRGGAEETATSPDPPPMMLFSDFIASKSSVPPLSSNKTAVSDTEMDALIERTSEVLQDAVEALQQVRAREARGVRGAMAAPSEGVANGDAKGTPQGTAKSTAGRRPSFLSGLTVGGEREVHVEGSQAGAAKSAREPSAPNSPPSTSSSPSSGSIDGWFRGKVDAGSLMAQQSASAKASPSRLEFKEKDQMPSVLEFTAHMEAPEASVMAMNEVFPEHLALRFQSELFSDGTASSPATGLNQPSISAAEETSTSSTTTSGEEFGPNGYWHRWTEVSGQNEKGTVVWTERWWEVSDWSGMKELGAEKYGMNEQGDVWRETWTEKIVIEEKSKKPMVLRSAHKWARAAGGREWEERWEEQYWSGGKTQKICDKWGREGQEVWHSAWGEDYAGEGTDHCVKWTNQWAESNGNKWGDKWREEFQGGVGDKTGETWSEPVGQEKYQRWWGERHMGEGRVQKYGNSTTGESWDVVEEMDTYYNPIPHFTYEMALSHSPQLHDVPTLPIDEEIIF
jgi:hypothetical protein